MRFNVWGLKFKVMQVNGEKSIRFACEFFTGSGCVVRD